MVDMSSEETKKAFGRIYGGVALMGYVMLTAFAFAFVLNQVLLVVKKIEEGADLKQLLGLVLASIFIIVPVVMFGISTLRAAREAERELEKL